MPEDQPEDHRPAGLTALGKALERARVEASMSKAQAARRAGLGRSTWDTLILGYIVRHGRHDPVKPKVENVVAAAKAVGLEVKVAVQLAGYQLEEPPQIVHLDLSTVSTEDLLIELAKRTDK